MNSNPWIPTLNLQASGNCGLLHVHSLTEVTHQQPTAIPM